MAADSNLTFLFHAFELNDLQRADVFELWSGTFN